MEDRDVLLVGAAAHGHIDGVADEVGSHVVGHGVADDLLGAAVQDGGQVHEPDPRADVRDVPDPFESGGPGGEVPAHEVGAGVDVVGGDGGADLPARLRGSQLLLAHDGADRVRRDRHALAVQCGGDAPVPVGHVRGVELGFDHQGQLPPSDLRGGVGPAEPVVVSGLGHSDQLAHGCDWAVAFFAADELVALAHRRSFAKKAAAFFKNSFSARSSLFSARSLAISADSAAASGSWASASFLLRLATQTPTVCGTRS